MQRSNLDGTNVTTLIDAFDINNPSGIFVTADSLYFTQQYAGVFRADLDGTHITSLVTGGSDYRFIDGSAVSAIPEPSTYAAFAGVLALGLAMHRRRAAGRAQLG